MVGLTFFSAKVIRTLGVKVVKMTNARGFCAELATAITVAVASRYGATHVSLAATAPFSAATCPLSRRWAQLLMTVH